MNSPEMTDQMQTILNMVCRLEGGFDAEIVKSPIRSKSVCHVRDIACYYLHKAGFSFPEIARFLGRHSHSTVQYARRRGEDKLQSMREFVESLDEEQRARIIELIEAKQQEQSNGT